MAVAFQPKARATVSWWLNLSRRALSRRAVQEQARMSAGAGASLADQIRIDALLRRGE